MTSDKSDRAKAKWKDFRVQLLELFSYQCCRCGRRKEDGAILQVHHIRYIDGRAKWNYGIKDCEILCKRCHAEVHKKIAPRMGWTLEFEDDLGEPIGSCDQCGTDIRFVFTISHPNWNTLDVGCDCCERMTDISDASDRLRRLKNRAEQQKRFLSSERWKQRVGGGESAKYRHQSLAVEKEDDEFYIVVNNQKGKLRFCSINDAKAHLFSQLYNGKLAKYFSAKEKRK